MNTPTGIRFSDEERKKISEFAINNNMKFSDVVRTAVKYYVIPDYGKGYLSLYELSLLQEKADMNLYFSQFLDDFKNAEDKFSLISKEPAWDKETGNRWYYTFAAAAHKLAHDNNLPVPQWCMKDKYFPKKKYYAFDTKDKEFREYLIKETPREYRWRNLYLGPNVLARA